LDSVFTTPSDSGRVPTKQHRRDIKDNTIHQPTIKRLAVGSSPTLNHDMLNAASSKIAQDGKERLSFKNQGSIAEPIGQNF